MNGPRMSTGTARADWRDEILREFTPGAARLTVVDDPDGLLAEAGIVEALAARGFAVVSLDDRIAFRFFYESRYRSRQDRGGLEDLVAVFTTGEAHEHAVPYVPQAELAGRQRVGPERSGPPVRGPGPGAARAAAR